MDGCSPLRSGMGFPGPWGWAERLQWMSSKKGTIWNGWLLTSEIWDGVPWPMRVGRKITKISKKRGTSSWMAAHLGDLGWGSLVHEAGRAERLQRISRKRVPFGMVDACSPLRSGMGFPGPWGWAGTSQSEDWSDSHPGSQPVQWPQRTCSYRQRKV